jgi:hypothetical protein
MLSYGWVKAYPHAPAALTPEETTPVTTEQEGEGGHSRSGRFG